MAASEDSEFTLFEQEERALRRAEAMLEQLESVATGVKSLADAYRQGYREQSRLVRLSDRIQLELHNANQKLNEQARELMELNAALQAEIERRNSLEQELRRVAITDTLTGVYTRGHVFDLAEMEIKRLRRTTTALSVLAIDLDHFKAVNDTFGHAAGDVALQVFAQTCRQELRQTDSIGRVGGEEFLVMLPDTPIGGAIEVAERIRSRLEASGFPWQNERRRLTASIGVATYQEADGSIDRLLARADEALYQAKNGGRNRVVASHGEG